jgi:hypothetical protein
MNLKNRKFPAVDDWEEKLNKLYVRSLSFSGI